MSDFKTTLADIEKAGLSKEETIKFLNSGEANVFKWQVQQNMENEDGEEEDSEQSEGLDEYLTDKFGKAGKPQNPDAEEFLGY